MRKSILFIGISAILLFVFAIISCFTPYGNYIKDAVEAMSDNDYDKAIAEFTEAISIKPDDATGYFWRGKCYYHKGQYDLAINDFTMAIKLKDGTLNSEYNARGLSYSAKGDYDSAISDFTIAIEISPHPLYFCNRGLAYHGKQDYKLAIENFTKAISLSPENEELYSKRADTYIAMGHTSLAITDLRKIIELSLSNNHSEFLQSARERLKGLGVTE